MTPTQAFERVTNEVGLRTVAVGLYRTITSKNPILILKDEQTAQLFKILLERLMKDGIHCVVYAETPTDPELNVLGEETYKQAWREFSGREICFVEEEQTVKNPGVDVLMELLVESQTKGYSKQQNVSDQFIDILHDTLYRITETASQTKDLMEELQKAPKRSARVKEVIKQNLKSKKEKDLVFHIFELLRDTSLNKRTFRQIETELEEFKARIGNKHPLYAFFSEHEQILSYLETLEKIQVSHSNHFTGEDYVTLRIIGENMVEANKHYRREEETLFPRLEAKGITSTSWLLKKDHELLQSRKMKLLEYSKDSKRSGSQLLELIGTLPHLVREHVFKENTILYPIAMEKVEEWMQYEKKRKK